MVHRWRCAWLRCPKEYLRERLKWPGPLLRPARMMRADSQSDHAPLAPSAKLGGSTEAVMITPMPDYPPSDCHTSARQAAKRLKNRAIHGAGLAVSSIMVPFAKHTPNHGISQVFRARRHRTILAHRVGTARLLHRHPRCRKTVLQHPVAAAERHRHLAYGPRLQPDHHGWLDALPPHAGPQHGLDPWHRPRGYRHANRRATPAGRAKNFAP